MVRGHLKAPHLHIDLPIGEPADPDLRRFKMTTPRGGSEGCHKPRPAQTQVLVLSRGSLGCKPATKVLLKPRTGRRHQLRVHCAEIGHPIAGDYTYSGGCDNEPDRMFLHSYKLVLPNSLENLDVTSTDPFEPSDVEGANDYREQQVIRQLDSEVFSAFKDEGRIFWATIS